MIKRLFTTGLALSLGVAALACDNCKKDYVFGPGVPVGNGMAFAWARLDKETKKPVAVGVTLSESALEGLPQGDEKMPMVEYMLELPKEIKGMPYDHVGLDWNPKGHIPPGIYDVPHFDIHFYTVGQNVRNRITAKGDDLKKCTKAPDPRFVPAGYIMPPGTSEPRMGTHWVDPKSPELNGQPFTTTFLYGSYDGRSAFWEPMITLDFLKGKPTFQQDVAQPKAFQMSGYYPKSYKVSYNEPRKEYNISLEGLAFVQGAK